MTDTAADIRAAMARAIHLALPEAVEAMHRFQEAMERANRALAGLPSPETLEAFRRFTMVTPRRYGVQDRVNLALSHLDTIRRGGLPHYTITGAGELTQNVPPPPQKPEHTPMGLADLATSPLTKRPACPDLSQTVRKADR